MQITTHGKFISLDELKANGAKMKRIAYGQVNAERAYTELHNTQGAVILGERHYGRVGIYYYGILNNNKQFVYECEGLSASSLYVEQ